MPYLNGVVTAGIAEATRFAQTIVHRAAEAGVVAVEGEREYQAHADHIPDVAAGARIDRRERERERRRRRQGQEHDPHTPPHDPDSGSLIDVQA